MTWLTCVYCLYCTVLFLSIYFLFIKSRRKKDSNSVAKTDVRVVLRSSSIIGWFAYPCCLSVVIFVFWKEVSPGLETIDSWWSRPFFIWIHYSVSIICWLCCVFSSAGVVMKEPAVSKPDIGMSQQTAKDYCIICEVPKAPDSKHCYFCNVCVPRWDHHCLWICNCIGSRNIHFFSAFLTHCACMWLHGAYICSFIAMVWTPNHGKQSFISYWFQVVNNQFQLALYATLLYLGGLVFFTYSCYYLFLCIMTKNTKERMQKRC
ncbi:hypothetical protein GpartN1_g5734.t1 [Galdieria partita]|uniref:Palmitoyltransferase n=1 Tax=Galdieria partita TaxID=83374 RepID=A0A9C7USK6_9RHOD|nr:hypothetical protein GpartN1_g5734.t1 [Galdieria partita]